MSAVLNSVYNNYLAAYTPKSVTRYDAHKRSELRSIYNSIVKLNKESPWYLPTTSKTTQQYAIDLKENARELHNTIAQLGGLEESGLLDKKSAYSTDDEVAVATYIGVPPTDGTTPSFKIEVQALASSQENMGLFLEESKVTLPADTYSFDITINDMNYEFQFAIGESETNREVQERLARLINHASIGIKASLIESGSRTSLRLVSESTGSPMGKEHIFRVSDDHTSKTSGAVAYFGLDYISRDASNARFLINGEDRFASSNHFTVGKMFDVELKGISPEGEPTEIGLKPDLESLTDNVTHLIDGYNSFVQAANSYLDTQAKSRQLVHEMSGITSLYKQPLESTGLDLSDDGTVTIDTHRLQKAAQESESIAQTFGYIKDFSNMLLRKVNQVSLNPMEYVEKTVVAYKNPGHNFVSPYATSSYSGMMFNGYC